MDRAGARRAGDDRRARITRRGRRPTRSSGSAGRVDPGALRALVAGHGGGLVPGVDGLFVHPVMDDEGDGGQRHDRARARRGARRHRRRAGPLGRRRADDRASRARSRALQPATRVYRLRAGDGGAADGVARGRASRCEVDYTPSFVDGAGAKGLLPPMWERARPLLAGARARSSLDETAAAVRLLAERARVIAEGAGALAVAAAVVRPRGDGPHRLHRLGRQHRRRPAGCDPGRPHPGLTGFRSSAAGQRWSVKSRSSSSSQRS